MWLAIHLGVSGYGSPWIDNTRTSSILLDCRSDCLQCFSVQPLVINISTHYDHWKCSQNYCNQPAQKFISQALPYGSWKIPAPGYPAEDSLPPSADLALLSIIYAYIFRRARLQGFSGRNQGVFPVHRAQRACLILHHRRHESLTLQTVARETRLVWQPFLVYFLELSIS